MIYKIQSGFNNLSKIMNKLSDCFDFIYTNNALYIALRNYTDLNIHSEIMNNILKPSSYFRIVKIDENNLKSESVEVKDWCRDNFVRLELQEYEIKEQKHLQSVMTALDRFEEFMEKELTSRCGKEGYSGDNNGEEKKRKTSKN